MYEPCFVKLKKEEKNMELSNFFSVAEGRSDSWLFSRPKGVIRVKTIDYGLVSRWGNS
jgi:hypothetical protein